MYDVLQDREVTFIEVDEVVPMEVPFLNTPYPAAPPEDGFHDKEKENAVTEDEFKPPGTEESVVSKFCAILYTCTCCAPIVPVKFPPATDSVLGIRENKDVFVPV